MVHGSPHAPRTKKFFKEEWYSYSHKDSISAVQLDCQAPLERVFLCERENVGGFKESNGTTDYLKHYQEVKSSFEQKS